MKNFGSIIGNGIMYILTIVQTKELFQVISLVLSILISLVILIEKICNWYKKAKEDGKITSEEIQQLKEDTKEEIEQIVDVIKEVEEKDNGK